MAVNKPIVLNETGQSVNQKIQAIGAKIDADRISTTQQLEAIIPKIESNGAEIAQQLQALRYVVDQKLEAMTAEIPSIVAAMDQLDIIYYVEP